MSAQPDSPPTVAFYCATFLRPEMLHIYRQITGLKRVRPLVIAQKRENADRFPFDQIEVVGKPPMHWWRRFWFRQVQDRPWQISRAERDALLETLGRNQARVLHVFFAHIAVHLLPLIRVSETPAVVSFHGADVGVDLDRPAYRRATREVLGAVQRVFVRSNSLRRAVLDLGCPEHKIDIVRTGIPLEEFPFRQRQFPSDGGWHLLQACRLIEKKGLGTTLHAFTHFLAQYPKATLTIAGEGPMLDELRELTRKLKIDNRVVLPGFVSSSQLRELLYRSHIFVHPSQLGRDGNQEGVPNSLLEAMATGLPVFATDHGGIPEAVENGVGGILVPERDHAALAEALLHGAEDPELLSRLARNGADAVAKNFSRERQIETLEQIYLSMMS